jgi:hypothetical protein
MPLELFACKVYVLVADGVATTDPVGPPTNIDPLPVVIVTLPAPETFQLSVVEPPRGITFGTASKVLITGMPPVGVDPPTVMVTICDTLPAEFVAVKI